MLQRRAVILLSILLVPLLSGIFAPSFGSASAAIDDCQGTLSPIVWNETISRHAEVPFNNYWDPFYYEEDWDDDGRDRGRSSEPMNSGGENIDPSLSPEEPWMYNAYHSPVPVDTLTSNIATTILVGNDSAGALRVNLSSSHRTTICVEIQGIVGNSTVPAKADVYLMTTSQYERYEWSYNRMHGTDYDFWFDRESLSDDEFVTEVSPEWAAFDVTGWKTYRDVHTYENTDSVVMSVALDAPEVHSSLFSGTTYQEFFIVIDAWDNSRRGDAGAQNKIIAADVAISTVERSIVLPNWTVSIVFFVFFAAIIMAPVLINKRYMGAGLEPSIEAQKQLMPSLNQN
jgi:hypothetical protein|tara:strand:+ start:2082 stop:3110 length:1029 start_codon:yes stop_codon:yes gene_type:complete